MSLFPTKTQVNQIPLESLSKSESPTLSAVKNQSLVGQLPGKSSGSYNRVVPPHIRANAFKLWAYQKVYEKGEDCIIGYSGKTGTGKTTLSCKHAEDFDLEPLSWKRRFPYKEIRDGKEILVPRLVNSVTEYQNLKAERRYPTGTVTIIDEAQVLLNSRDFMTSKNRDMIRLFSTGRVYKHFTFLNLPHWQHLDNQIKSYLHAVVICHRPNKRKGLSYYTPYLVEPMGYGKPPMTKLFRYRSADGRLRRLDVCEDTLPSQELMEAEEKKVNAWKDLVRTGQITGRGDKVSHEKVLTVREQKHKEKMDRAEVFVKEWASNRFELKKGSEYSISKIKAKALLQGVALTQDIGGVIALRFQEMDEKRD